MLFCLYFLRHLSQCSLPLRKLMWSKHAFFAHLEQVCYN